MIRQTVYLLLVCCLIAGLAMCQAPTAKPSFEAFRLRSGMTPDDVSKEFPNYELRWLAQPHGAAMLVERPVNPDDPDIYASLSFCNNRLWSVIRDVDPDTEFLTYVQDYVHDYGQPTVKVEKQPWTGKNGGDISSLVLTWIAGGIRRHVTLFPEGRTGAGELRYTRNASIGLSFNTPCNKTTF
jgi:hypothetical protein